MIKPIIVYEDASILVLNKPCGLNSDVDKAGNPSVEGWVKNYYSQYKNIHPVLMHRLDRLASGLLIISKKPTITKQLQHIFEHRRIVKKYFAVVHRCTLPDSGILKHFLKKDINHKKSVVVKSSALGQEAVLKYKILQKKEEYSLLEIDLMTGRYHQIRTQLAAIRCPIVGDTLYGSNVASGIDIGIALHAFFLQINTLFQEKKLQWIAYPNPLGVWNLFF